MNQLPIIGLDLGIRTAHQAVLLRDEVVAGWLRVTTEASSLDKLVEWAGVGARVVMEPVGPWLIVASYLNACGMKVLLVNPVDCHALRKANSRRVKSDCADAETLARAVKATPKRVREFVPTSAELIALQHLVKARARLVQDRTREFFRLVALMGTFVPDQARLLSRKLTPAQVELLRHYADPTAALDAGAGQLVSELAIEEKVATAWLEAAKTAVDLWRKARAGARKAVDFHAVGTLVDLQLQRIAELDRHIDRLQQDIEAAYLEADPHEVLRSVPGVGAVIAPVLLAVIGNVTRFSSGAKLVAYFGLDPTKNQSGGNDKKGLRISKAGSRIGRHAIYLAADTARQIDPELARAYARFIQAGKHHTEAVIAVANRLLRRIHSVLMRLSRGDTSGYQFRNLDGEPISKATATKLTRAEFPSKRTRLEQQKKSQGSKREGRGSKAPHRTSRATGSGPQANTNPVAET